jgi:flagellar motor switch protein FliM
MDQTNETAQSQAAEVLSQNEVERLLAEVTSQEHGVVVHHGGEEKSRRAQETIQPYDFRNPVFLSQADLRKLRLHHEEFIKNLASRLSMYLRMEFGLQMSKLHTIPFDKFTEGLNNPSHITIFKIDPLRGLCVLELHPRLGLTIVDRLLGGPAHSINHEHDLSDIERALLEQVVNLIMSEWCGSWAPFKELRSTLLGTENNGRFLNTAPHDTIFLALTMEARVGDCMEQMQLGIPFHTIEPLIRRLSHKIDSATSDSPQQEARPNWNRQFDDVPVPVTAEWQDLEMSARQIANLREGDIIRLDPAMSREVRVRLSQITKFNAQLGTNANSWAVQLTDVLKSA